MSHVVPKRRVDVRVHLVNGDSRRGCVYIDYIDVIHRGEQTLLDKFNDDFVWFAMNAADGSMEILNRNQHDVRKYADSAFGRPADPNPYSPCIANGVDVSIRGWTSMESRTTANCLKMHTHGHQRTSVESHATD